MKKKILLLILALILITPVRAAQNQQRKENEYAEITLEDILENEEKNTETEYSENYSLFSDNALKLSENVPQAVSISSQKIPQEKTLKEKLQDIYHLEVDKYDAPNYLLKDVFTHKFDEDSIWDRTQLWAGYNGDIGLQFTEGSMGAEHTTNHYDINTINVGFDGFLKNNNGDFRVMINISPFSERNFVQNLFADMYVATNKIPHHRIMVGHTRPPVGMEGAYGPFVLPFIARSQISRNFGTVRKLGARISGDYSLLGYDFGVYSSDTYFQEFFPGAEFIGRVDLKPLGKTDGRYGKLLVGGSMDAGHRNNNFCVVGAHIRYEYKRFMANFEWAQANGYNGPIGHSVDTHASGFYATLGYMLTKKLQILARYDEFDPNREIAHNNQREYSVGLNYFIKGQGLRLILNYVFCQNDATKDSHRIMLGTQILI